MMVFVYRYATATPPAPYVLVTLSGLDGRMSATDLPAKVDTGADRTVIPLPLATRLGLEVVERLTFAGLGGQQVELPVYQCLLVVRDLEPIVMNVAASDGEPHILLGRDVLNRYKITLDGPGQVMTISDDP